MRYVEMTGMNVKNNPYALSEPRWWVLEREENNCLAIGQRWMVALLCGWDAFDLGGETACTYAPSNALPNAP